MFLELSDFVESPKLMVLDSIDVARLVELINDSTNYSGGDCGTFALNAGIVVFKEDRIKGLISIGCAFNQWEFDPFNINSRYGSMNEKGFNKMTKMLDEIYSKNRSLDTGS